MKKFSIVNITLAFLIVFGVGYWAGAAHPISGLSSPSTANVVNQDKGKPSNVDFSLFWDAWNIVQAKYVKTPNDQDRLYGAIAGMVDGLGDPFSSFMKPSEAAEFNSDIQGNFDGIGAELILKDGLITVVAPLDDSPAQKAGLRADDIIVKINDKDAPKVLEDAVKQIRGPKGTQVKLTIIRNGKSQDITITRDNVEVKSVTFSDSNSIGTLKINQFTENTTDLLDQALAKAKQDNDKGLIIDLRNNPGGLLDQAISVTSRFIDPGTVVIERDKAQNEHAEHTVDVSNRVTMPIVLLVNKGSASAAEIFTGAIQDNNRGKVVGETTFGKGSVQSLEPLKDGSILRITIAEWLTPKKRAINKIGLTPDVPVSMSDDDIKAGHDPQMDKALEILKGEI